MSDLIFGFSAAFFRWIYIYKCNSKKMSDAYNSNPSEEGVKNNMAGLFLIPISIII